MISGASPARISVVSMSSATLSSANSGTSSISSCWALKNSTNCFSSSICSDSPPAPRPINQRTSTASARISDICVTTTSSFSVLTVSTVTTTSFSVTSGAGQHPARVGILDYLRPDTDNGLSTNQVTIAEMLQHAGYATGMRCGRFGPCFAHAGFIYNNRFLLYHSTCQ